MPGLNWDALAFMWHACNVTWGGGYISGIGLVHIRQQAIIWIIHEQYVLTWMASPLYKLLPLFATRIAACTGGIWGSLFHAATSILNWYEMAYMANVLYRPVRWNLWACFLHMCNLEHRHFHWRIIVALAQNPTVMMSVDITGTPNSSRNM